LAAPCGGRNELLTIPGQTIEGEFHHLEASMAQELLTYAELAHRLNISTSAAKMIAKGLRLPRYAAPDGRSVVLCDVAQLRETQDEERAEVEPIRRASRMRGRDSYGDLSTSYSAACAPLHRPVCWSNSRAETIASLHDRIDELQRQLDRVENAGGHEAAVADNPLLAELCKVAAQAGAAKQTADKAREEIAAYRSRPWWKRASA
jgi:hypothetical protein